MRILRPSSVLPLIPVDRGDYVDAVPIDMPKIFYRQPAKGEQNLWKYSGLRKTICTPSVLNRNPFDKQSLILRDKILPLLVEKNKGEKNLTFLFIGPATCEEVATTAARVIQGLKSLKCIDSQKVKFVGLDFNDEYVFEGLKRITAQKPFSVELESEHNKDFFSAYEKEVAEIIDSLNEYPRFLVDNYEVIVEDATNPIVLAHALSLKPDVIISNFSFYNLSYDKNEDAVAEAFIKKANDAFVLTNGPIQYFLADTHYIDNLTTPRTMVPLWAARKWVKKDFT